MENNELRSVTNFFFETGLLQRLKRSGIDFLGTGDQTVAEHVFRTSVIGYVLSEMLQADTSKVVMLCLFHDIEESRTGDLNYLQQRYVKSDDEKALEHVVENLPMKSKLLGLLGEFEKQDSLEAVIAKDADTLELILFLKEELDKGNQQASDWIYYAKKRLVQELSKKIALEIENTHYSEWWKSLTDEWDKGTKQW